MKDDAHEKEPLLNGLDHVPDGVFELPRASEALRRTLRARTCAVVRRRARRRRLARAGSLAAAYAAGILTAVLAWNAGRSPDQPAVAELDHAQQEPAVDEDRPAEQESDDSAAPHAFDADSHPEVVRDEEPPSDVDPQQLRASVADASPHERIELLRRAGDLYLNRSADIQSALDCYQQVLELLPAEERTTPQRNDSWLLAELKQAYSAEMQ